MTLETILIGLALIPAGMLALLLVIGVWTK